MIYRGSFAPTGRLRSVGNCCCFFITITLCTQPAQYAVDTYCWQTIYTICVSGSIMCRVGTSRPRVHAMPPVLLFILHTWARAKHLPFTPQKIQEFQAPQIIT